MNHAQRSNNGGENSERRRGNHNNISMTITTMHTRRLPRRWVGVRRRRERERELGQTGSLTENC